MKLTRLKEQFFDMLTVELLKAVTQFPPIRVGLEL